MSLIRNNYISLTDMIRANEPDAERTGMILQNWMRRKDTIEYIGFWETLSNPDFNVREFEYIRNEAGTNRPQRFETLHQMATEQLALLDRSNAEHKFRKLLGNDGLSLTEK